MPDHIEPTEWFWSETTESVVGGLSRRALLHRAAVASLAVSSGSLLAACGGDDGDSGPARTVAGIPGKITSKSVVYADVGGTTRDASTSAYFDSFRAATGVKVVNADIDDARFLLMARRGRPQWDGLLNQPMTGLIWAQEGLLERLPNWIPRSDFDIDPGYRDYQAGGFFGSNPLGYLNSAYPTRKPESWPDFFDVARFPGKRAMVNQPIANFEVALLADGVPPEQLLPLDFDRAKAKLDSIRKHLILGENAAEVQQMLSSGAASMAVMVNGRMVPLIRAGTDLGISWNQAIMQGHTGPVVARGAPHADAIFALMYWMTDPQRQAAFVRTTGYGPSNEKALEFLDDETLALLPNSPEHLELAVTYDFVKRGEQQEEYIKQWTQWLEG